MSCPAALRAPSGTPLDLDTMIDYFMTPGADGLARQPSVSFFDLADTLPLDMLLGAAPTLDLPVLPAAANNAPRFTTAALTKLSRPTKHTTATGEPRKRAPKQAVPEEKKDAKYWERRAKNTKAAADNRRLKRLERLMQQSQLSLLDTEQVVLLDEVEMLQRELASLQSSVRARLAAHGYAAATAVA